MASEMDLSIDQTLPQGIKRPRNPAEGSALDTSDTERESKRARLLQNDSIKPYIDIYNEAVSTCIEPDPDHKFEDSQVGSVRWTGDEKQAFFHGLDRYGRDDVRQISRLIGTKSEPEVEDYMILLQLGAEETYLYDLRNCVRHFEIPAAWEVPSDLASDLDVLSSVVSKEQNDFEAKAIKSMYGKLGVVSRYHARKVEQGKLAIEDYVPPSPFRDDAVAAFDLLDVPCMLKLSTNIFMNSSDEAHRYTTYVNEPETPSIRLSAVVDLYRLIRTLLERLMLAAHHCACSLNNLVVSQRDVDSAWRIFRLQCPQLPESRWEFWATVARRHGIQVWGESGEEQMSWDHVESFLRSPPRRKPRVLEELSATTSHLEVDAPGEAGKRAETLSSSQTVSAVNRGASEGAERGEEGDQPPNHEGGASSAGHRGTSEDSDHGISDEEGFEAGEQYTRAERLQDEYLENIDTEASQAHANAIRAFIDGKTSQLVTKTTDTFHKPKTAWIRQTRAIDWRKRLKYESQWEHFSNTIKTTSPTPDQLGPGGASHRAETSKVSMQESRDGRSRPGSDVSEDGEDDGENLDLYSVSTRDDDIDREGSLQDSEANQTDTEESTSSSTTSSVSSTGSEFSDGDS